MRPEEVEVREALSGDDVQEREGEGGVAPGEGLEVEICGIGGRGAHRVDDDHGGRRLRQPVLVGVWRRRGRVCAPDEDAGRVASGQRVEAHERGAVHVLERHVPGLVADRVRVDLGGPEPVEEAEREEVRQEREGAGVVRVQDRVRPDGRLDSLQSLGDLGKRLVPGDGLEPALALGSGAA